MYKFKFADIGEGLHEGLVGEIYVKVGDTIAEGDSLFAVETDKVNSDIPSPVDGVVKEILIKKGETVHVGDITMHIDDGEADHEEPETSKPAPAEAKSDDEEASVVGDIKSSNDVFSFDMFNKSAPKKAPVATPETPKTSDHSLPNPGQVKPVGNGEKVDVVVIGTGPGGYEVAARLSRQGLKVAAIEDRFAGGVCLNIGCIPTKTLLKGAKVLYSVAHAEELGLNIDQSKIKVDWSKMLERKNKITNMLSKGVEGRIKMAKAEFIKGRAEVIDRYNVKVNDRVLTTKYIIIASGSSPIKLEKLPGFAEAYASDFAITSKEALDLPKIPKSIAIVGGGVIGVEFAALFNRMGSKVTIFEGTEALLGPMDNEVKKLVQELMVEKGVEVKTNVKVVGLEPGKIIVEVAGKTEKLAFDKVLVSVGRKANNLGLDQTLGLKLGPRGEIVVNEIMQTNVDNVFAIGDVVGHNMLAHVAYKHASVIEAAFKGQKQPYDQSRIPGVVYIYPEISSIGYTEEALKAQGQKYFVSKWKNSAVGRDLAENDLKGFTKLLIEPEFGTILGAHIVNASSSEMIAEIAAIMELEGTVHELAWITHPHPSASEGIWEAAVAAVEKLEKTSK